MTHQAAPVYDSLHFREYLGGSNKPPYTSFWINPDAVPPHSHNPFDKIEGSSNYNQLKQAKTHPETDIIIGNYSHICQQSLHCGVVAVDFPGGRQRSSFRLFLDNGHTAIATRRFDPSLARIEYYVMYKLGELSAPIPKCYTFNGLVLIQEDLPGTRLSEALKSATEMQYTQWMHQALVSLLEIQQLAESQNLHLSIPVTGCEPEWLIALIDRTALLGNHTGIPCPKVPVSKIYDHLTLLKPRFNKWDARPGNAMLDPKGRVKWFDWEHCCARNSIDDIAWLLCDDAVPEYPEAEQHLINTHLESFTDGRDPQYAQNYLSVFGTHHACVRICRLLDEKGYDSWPEFEDRVAAEPNSLLAITQRLCTKASRWAAKSSETVMLQDWFLQVRERLPTL